MSRPDFSSLQGQLRELGLSRSHSRRTCQELESHYLDLVDCYTAQGINLPQAQSLASDELGSLENIVEQVRLRPELRSWEFHYPWLALLVYPVACAGLLPVAMARSDAAGILARWAACVAASGLVTATILLVLQLSITLT